MNNINLPSLGTYHSDTLPQKQSNFKVCSLEDHFRIVCEVSQKDHVLLKIAALVQPIEDFSRVIIREDRQEKGFLLKIASFIQPIFKVLSQLFECISHYACLLANGIISIKTKLIGIDLHLHLHLFTVNVNYGDTNAQKASPSEILSG
ncbi:hypothetical protein [Candidatus Protochlamydia sp. W-9]|uniref:hypothetical protein n=1 Tax=Candidatus Protochlamydia sp. W-9 TaxID=1785087 RepID=UPI00096A24D5|nr:hypothetical protein [Candidatus Protochlamydia sp. W-9]